MYKYFEYVEFDGEKFFTVVRLPEKEGKYPTVIIRNPYVDPFIDLSVEEALEQYGETDFCNRGYAVPSRVPEYAGRDDSVSYFRV